MKVIVLSIDALRADSLSCYGYERNTSPCIDRIARAGTIFRNAYTQAHRTPSSFYSLITGLYPSVHGITWFDQRPSTPVATLPEIMVQDGYRTLFFSNFHVLLDRNRFGSHFEEIEYFEIDRHWMQLKNRLLSLEEDNLFLLLHIGNYVHEPFFAPADLVREFWVEDFPQKEIIRELTEDRGFGTDSMMKVLRKINLRQTILSSEEVRYLKACYDAGIKYVDRWVDDFFHFLQDYRDEDIIFIITGDHGQGFFEHGFFGHGLNLHEELVNVPLIFWSKKNGNTCEVKTVVQLVDIFPTIVEILGIQNNLNVDGLSFKECLKGKEDENRIAICEGFPFVAYVYKRKKLIISLYKVISVAEKIKRLGSLLLKCKFRKLLFHLYSFFKTSLYDLDIDPEEERNLIRIERKCYREMKTFVRDWYVKCSARTLDVTVEQLEDDTIIEQLKSLGYL